MNDKYRKCVGAMILNKNGKVFVARRRVPFACGGAWQMPQGGIDEGEDVESALFRELLEETGLKKEHVEIIASNEEWIYYDVIEDYRPAYWKEKGYVGQRQKWFLLRFTGKDSYVDLDYENPPEFLEWRWEEVNNIENIVVDFKKGVYRKVIDAFKSKCRAKKEN